MSAAAFRALALALLMLSATPLRAQEFDLSRITPTQMQQFRVCRAALFYHLDGTLPREAQLPRSFAEALLEQMTFIMAETIRNAPHVTVGQSRAAMDFTERFFLGFSRTIAERTDLKADIAARERLMIECQPLIWEVLRDRVDMLLARRELSVRPAAPPGP